MVIGCFGEVNEAMLGYVGEHVIRAGVDREDLIVLISTYGGELYPALGIHDLLKHHASQGYKVTTIALGACMSAGMVLLQSGTKRAMTENATLMCHYGADGAEGVDDAKQNAAMHKLHKDIVGGRTKVTTRTINTWFGKNTYFNAAEALKVGLIDEVLKSE